jgi:hypothetical protein
LAPFNRSTAKSGSFGVRLESLRARARIIDIK